MKIYECYYCKFKSPNVEASGIYYCPNAHCSGPGGTWFRCKLKSFKEYPWESGHSVDEREYYWKAWLYMFKQRIRRSMGLKHKL